MIAMLNDLAMFVGYSAIVFGVLWALTRRSQHKANEFLNTTIQNHNDASRQRLLETDPEAWAYAERRREACKARNSNRREQIASLQREMEDEF